jgi:hypothetical protein
LAAAFLVVWRDTILAAPAGSPAVTQLFARDAGTSLTRLLRAAYDLRHRTPADLVVDNPFRVTAAGGGPGHDRQGIPLAEGGLVVIPRGATYPVFEGFPKRAVTWAAAERDRLRAEEEALLARQRVVRDMSKRTDRLQQMEAAWGGEQVRMAALEEARRGELADVEAASRAEADRWEHLERAERLRQIEVIESAYHTTLERKKDDWSAELEKLRCQVEDKRATFRSEMKRRGEDEQLRTLEFQAQQRLCALEEEQTHAAALGRVRQEVTAATAAEEAEEKRRAVEWQTADEEVAARREHEASRRTRLAAARHEADAKASAGDMMLRRSMERDVHVATVEKERRLREAAEAEATLSSAAVEAVRVRDATVAAAEFQELERAAALEADTFAAASRQRKEVIDGEWSSAALDAEARVARMREAERAGRRATLESAAAERRRKLLAAAAEEEAAVKRTTGIVSAQRRRDRELEVDMQVRSVDPDKP